MSRRRSETELRNGLRSKRNAIEIFRSFSLLFLLMKRTTQTQLTSLKAARRLNAVAHNTHSFAATVDQLCAERPMDMLCESPNVCVRLNIQMARTRSRREQRENMRMREDEGNEIGKRRPNEGE